MKWTLDKKILAGFAGCALILIVVAVISFRNSEKFLATNYWVEHTREVLLEFDQILQSSVDAETGARGYVITGNDVFLEPYNAAVTKIGEHIQKVKDLTVDNPAEQKNIEELQKAMDAHLNYIKLCIESRQTKGAKAATELVATGEGKHILDEVRRLIDVSKGMENTLLAERQKTSNEDARNFSIVFTALLLVIGVVLVSVYLIINTNLKALRKAESETNEKNWRLNGSAQLAASMQGNQTVFDLAQSVINHLVTYVDAQIGALYLLDENGRYLRMAAGYAVDKLKKTNPVVSLGEGIVGQAAAEKKTLFINDIPANYFVINSGLGDVIPRNIMAFPLVFEGNVMGVAELGATSVFTELHKEYIKTLVNNIAIGIVASQAREKTKELLEETQRQSEELETQQEELRQSNEELTQKTDLLERSEANLKVQQEELQQSNEELEEKANLLEEQKEKLENVKAEVEKKARELEITGKYKSQFLANMSHELRTPLNSVLILSQLLFENKGGGLKEKEIEFAKNIYNSGNDLLNLINEILDLSKIEAGKLELDIANITFNDIERNMTSMFSEVAKNKQVDFKINYNKATIGDSLTTDKQRLEQILRNLLSNAFKFTGRGGHVSLTIGKAPAGITFKNKKIESAGNILLFSVTDSGIGIPKDKMEIIFEAFQQADGSTKRKYGGTGLGLSISRELANVLGGEIQVQSEEGKGSTFTLYLPAKFDAAIMAPVERNIEIKDAGKTELQVAHKHEAVIIPEGDFIDDRYSIGENDRVALIIEDDIEFAKILLGFARERKFKGIVAHQGNSGLSYARHYKPDAIILDMKLPVMDGAEVLMQLKNDPAMRHIPVHIISGYDKRKEGIALGAFDFTKKPVSKDDLERAFDRVEDFISKKLKKLLVVEDNVQHNNAIVELIGNGDVKCFPVFSGEEAFNVLNKELFDCIIVDLGLPDMSGFELLEKLRADENLNKIPVIVYTGKDLSKEETNALNRLANTVVLKTADSHERLLDEAVLFLHRIESKLPKEKQNLIRKLHRTDEVLKNKRVLLVDDDIRNIYSLSNALEEEGMQCLTAENGKFALEMLRQNPAVDIILMDVMMPEMDGYEATKAIRNIGQFSKIPIVALTAKAMKGDREKCLNAGMSDYIAKPVNMEQLLSLMRVWLYRA